MKFMEKIWKYIVTHFSYYNAVQLVKLFALFVGQCRRHRKFSETSLYLQEICFLFQVVFN